MMLRANKHRRDAASVVGTNCCALATCVWVFYALISMQQLIVSDLIVPRVRRTITDVSRMRLPNFYVCPADRERTQPPRWRSFDCHVTFRGEKATCGAGLETYKGKEPDDLDGRRHGKGSCIEFSTHNVLVMQEYSAAWNEIVLRATFDAATMFDAGKTNVLQEVELGYRAAETEFGQELDKYYYPLLRVPTFYVGEDINTMTLHKSSGVATRAFLGKEVDRMPDVTGRYWYVYGGMQVPLLNASFPEQLLVDASTAAVMPSKSVMGFVHIVLTIEDFETYSFSTVPFVIPLFRALGEIAGVGALMAWVTHRFRGAFKGALTTLGLTQVQERASSRLVAFAEEDVGPELDTDRKYFRDDHDYNRAADHDDIEESGGLLAGARE